MIIKEYSKEYKLELMEALKKTQDLGCPPEQYRVSGHSNCFNCNECWQYALSNSMDDEKKEETETITKLEFMLVELEKELECWNKDDYSKSVKTSPYYKLISDINRVKIAIEVLNKYNY